MAVTLITPVGRLSYPALFKAKPNKKGELKFGCALILDPDKCGPIKDAILKAAQEKWGEKALDGLKHGRLKNPLRKGEEREDEAYHGKLFFNCVGNNRPGIVNHLGQPVTDPDLVYPGMFVRLHISIYPFDVPENKGVGIGLNHVQIVGAGERLDNRVSAEKAFNDGASFDGYDTSGLAGGASGGGSAEGSPWD